MLFLPEAARFIAAEICLYTIYDENADPVCACSFNSVAAEMQPASMPNTQKQVFHETDWLYLRTEKTDISFIALLQDANLNFYYNNNYQALFTKNIFHPPGVA